jgi:hypothetical protein
LKIKVKGKCPGSKLKSGWGQVRKNMTQREGQSWEEIEVEELWEGKDKWRGMIIRWVT